MKNLVLPGGKEQERGRILVLALAQEEAEGLGLVATGPSCIREYYQSGYNTHPSEAINRA